MQERTEGWFKRVTARAYYALLRKLTQVDMPAAAGDFRLVDRVAVDAFVSMRERDRYVRGMFAWLGFKQTGIDYVPPPRYAGHSKYTVRRMARLAFDGIFSFSIYPLRLVLIFGLVCPLLSFVIGIALGDLEVRRRLHRARLRDDRRRRDLHRRHPARRARRARRVRRAHLRRGETAAALRRAPRTRL